MQDRGPIVFIHWGDSPYLSASLLQLRYTNADAKIIFIGDTENRKYKKLVDHFLISDFFKRANEFENIYKHFSTNGYRFELLCLQRWFVLYEFMMQQKLDQCIYLDSDVLAYSNLVEQREQLLQYGMTVVGISAHTNFVNRRSVLKNFCDFVWNVYSVPSAGKDLEERFKKFKDVHQLGGISDMTFFTAYRDLHPDEIGDLAVVRKGSAFDITLDTTLNFEETPSTGYKKVIWIQKKPFAIQLHSGLKVMMHTLHFQGKCKKEIKSFVTFSFRFQLYLLQWSLRYYINLVVRKMKVLFSYGVKRS